MDASRVPPAPGVGRPAPTGHWPRTLGFGPRWLLGGWVCVWVGGLLQGSQISAPRSFQYTPPLTCCWNSHSAQKLKEGASSLPRPCSHTAHSHSPAPGCHVLSTHTTHRTVASPPQCLSRGPQTAGVPPRPFPDPTDSLRLSKLSPEVGVSRRDNPWEM